MLKIQIVKFVIVSIFFTLATSLALAEHSELQKPSRGLSDPPTEEPIGQITRIVQENTSPNACQDYRVEEINGEPVHFLMDQKKNVYFYTEPKIRKVRFAEAFRTTDTRLAAGPGDINAFADITLDTGSNDLLKLAETRAQSIFPGVKSDHANLNSSLKLIDEKGVFNAKVLNVAPGRYALTLAYKFGQIMNSSNGFPLLTAVELPCDPFADSELTHNFPLLMINKSVPDFEQIQSSVIAIDSSPLSIRELKELEGFHLTLKPRENDKEVEMGPLRRVIELDFKYSTPEYRKLLSKTFDGTDTEMSVDRATELMASQLRDFQASNNVAQDYYSRIEFISKDGGVEFIDVKTLIHNHWESLFWKKIYLDSTLLETKRKLKKEVDFLRTPTGGSDLAPQDLLEREFVASQQANELFEGSLLRKRNLSSELNREFSRLTKETLFPPKTTVIRYGEGVRSVDYERNESSHPVNSDVLDRLD